MAPSHLEDTMNDAENDKERKKVAASLHDDTYGITSDPLTQFACAFSGLIHDVDHQGIDSSMAHVVAVNWTCLCFSTFVHFDRCAQRAVGEGRSSCSCHL